MTNEIKPKTILEQLMERAKQPHVPHPDTHAYWHDNGEYVERDPDILYYNVAIPACDESGACWEDIEFVPARDIDKVVHQRLIRGPAIWKSLPHQTTQKFPALVAVFNSLGWLIEEHEYFRLTPQEAAELDTLYFLDTLDEYARMIQAHIEEQHL